MFHSIKSFGAIKQTAINCATITQIFINGFKDKPGTEVCVTELLKPELEITALEEMAIVDDQDTIQEFEDQGTDCCISIIL